jgi:predicted acyl esterase
MPGRRGRFASVDFHKRVLLPFYDHYLKGEPTDYLARPNVQYAVRGSNVMRGSDTWPPANVRYVSCYLTQVASQSVTSLNDGGLSRSPGASGATSYSYPNPGWVAGVVGFGPSGPAGGFDPVRRVLTFTGEPLAQDLEIAGPIKLTLFLVHGR